MLYCQEQFTSREKASVNERIVCDMDPRGNSHFLPCSYCRKQLATDSKARFPERTSCPWNPDCEPKQTRCQYCLTWFNHAKEQERIYSSMSPEPKSPHYPLCSKVLRGHFLIRESIQEMIALNSLHSDSRWFYRMEHAIFSRIFIWLTFPLCNPVFLPLYMRLTHFVTNCGVKMWIATTNGLLHDFSSMETVFVQFSLRKGRLERPNAWRLPFNFIITNNVEASWNVTQLSGMARPGTWRKAVALEGLPVCWAAVKDPLHQLQGRDYPSIHPFIILMYHDILRNLPCRFSSRPLPARPSPLRSKGNKIAQT